MHRPSQVDSARSLPVPLIGTCGRCEVWMARASKSVAMLPMTLVEPRPEESRVGQRCQQSYCSGTSREKAVNLPPCAAAVPTTEAIRRKKG